MQSRDKPGDWWFGYYIGSLALLIMGILLLMLKPLRAIVKWVDGKV